MGNKDKSTVALTLICLVLGFMLAVNFRTQQGVEQHLGVRETELRNKVIELVTKNQSLESQIKELEDLLNQYRSKAAAGESPSELLKQELENLQVLAGLTDVYGEGVIVTVNDSTKERRQYDDPNLFIVHDEDLLKIVNVLKAAGAEAIAINGLRLTAFSEITCAGPVILVNGTRLAPPYVIKAIGNKNTLQASLNMRGGIVENLRFWGIEIDVELSDEIHIPSFKGRVELQYIKTNKGGE
ncbi:DUF881 domain-containing protein [Anaerobranca gottschalkii]|uniref:Uncharacterized conserved protein YlxW, UPF0749 family n=1 Tax=Anaerobranca gottschalkii DSM 13577 TaxID=1120990 RepID=A0A1H9YVJ0_9FIRM|nr:DUF881 domain-containing protein [Anaerobranca gottschalkii]SES73195.1 Uncharacterized conserved protein YlxW, UPF0749 family [Anaerobranca gottschalkii DSM 13577]